MREVSDFSFPMNTQKWDPRKYKVKILVLNLFLYKILRSIIKSFQGAKAMVWVWMQTMGTPPCEYTYHNFPSTWDADQRGTSLRGNSIYTMNDYFFFPFYKFPSRMKCSWCGNIRAVSLSDSQWWAEKRWRTSQPWAFLWKLIWNVISKLICNLDFVCLYDFYSVCVIFVLGGQIHYFGFYSIRILLEWKAMVCVVCCSV